jgi:predicted RNase H-like HicB family nuclease
MENGGKMADITWYVENIKLYTGEVHEGAVLGIVRHLGLALKSNDSSLIAASDPAELEQVRESFLVKKLGREESEAELDAAIASILNKMSTERRKSRATVYYLLAEHFGQLTAFEQTDESKHWSGQRITVTAFWDEEAGVWVAESEDVPGLITEAKTFEALSKKLESLIPELLEANGSSLPLNAHIHLEAQRELHPVF